jgi:hypothetical protein
VIRRQWRALQLLQGRRQWRALQHAARAHRGEGARRRCPHQLGGGEEGLPGAFGCSGPLSGAALTAWATADAAAAYSIGKATSRGQGGALRCLAWSCTWVAGGRATYPGLGSRDVDSAARTSIAARSRLAVAAGAVHRPLQR